MSLALMHKNTVKIKCREDGKAIRFPGSLQIKFNAATSAHLR
jgi:hypothetical protein